MRSDLLRVLILLALIAPGCAMPRTIVEQSVIDLHPGAMAELDFWDALAMQPVVSNDDALHGLLLIDLRAESGHAENYEQRVEMARAYGWIRPHAPTPDPHESARIGMVAVAACELMEIRGGLTMRLLGRSPRACVRELVFMEFITPRSGNQSIKGIEFIDLIGRIDDETARRDRSKEISDQRTDELTS